MFALVFQVINDGFDGFFKVVDQSFFGSEPVVFVEAGFVDRGGADFDVCSAEDFFKDPACACCVERGGDDCDSFELVFGRVIAASEGFVAGAVNFSSFEDDDPIARDTDLVKEFEGDLGFGSLEVGIVACLAHEDDWGEFVLEEERGFWGSMIEASEEEDDRIGGGGVVDSERSGVSR